MRKSKSFRSNTWNLEKKNEIDATEELRKNLSKSIQFGNALLEENEALRAELLKYREIFDEDPVQSIERDKVEKDNLINEHKLEKENLEQEISDLRVELNNMVASNMQLTNEKETISRDFALAKKNLSRVIKNNVELRKEKQESENTEKVLTRRLSLNIDVNELDSYQFPLRKSSSFSTITPTSPPKSNFSPSTPQMSPSKSPLRDWKLKHMSDTTYLELKRSCSKQRLELAKKKEVRKKKTQQRRVNEGFERLRESLEGVKQCVFENSIWWSQQKFELSRTFNYKIKDIRKEETSEVKMLKKRIKKLEKEMKKKDQKYVKQISGFLEMFEVNKIYDKC